MKLVKSNTTISSDDAERRYEDWKKNESILRARQFNDACEQAGIIAVFKIVDNYKDYHVIFHISNLNHFFT